MPLTLCELEYSRTLLLIIRLSESEPKYSTNLCLIYVCRCPSEFRVQFHAFILTLLTILKSHLVSTIHLILLLVVQEVWVGELDVKLDEERAADVVVTTTGHALSDHTADVS